VKLKLLPIFPISCITGGDNVPLKANIPAAVLAEVLASLLTPTFAQPIDITPDARLALPLVAIVVGAVASVAALRRVTTADPAAAFS